MIEDKEVNHLIRDCEALRENQFTGKPTYQIFRGVSSLHWKNNPCVSVPNCKRQTLVFKEENIISRYCFDCYKISIKPRTVVELLKLTILFNKLPLADDNTRKCFVDTRPYTKSTYTGLIYFQSLQDAKDSLKPVTEAVAEQISSNIELSIKRGCSEFSEKYPEYGKLDSSYEPIMKYPDNWFEKEISFDTKGLTSELSPLNFDSYDTTDDKEDFTIAEHLIMLFWLCCAATFDDKSYLKFANISYAKIPNLRKPLI